MLVLDMKALFLHITKFAMPFQNNARNLRKIQNWGKTANLRKTHIIRVLSPFYRLPVSIRVMGCKDSAKFLKSPLPVF